MYFADEPEHVAILRDTVRRFVASELPPDARPVASSAGATSTRLDRLEQEVRDLRAELDSLKKQLGA